VRWYVSSLGSEDAIHTAHWHGITLNNNGHMVDQVVVQASSAYVLDAVPDNPGTWLFHCHLTDHIHGGMMARFHIAGQAPVQKLDGKVSTCPRGQHILECGLITEHVGGCAAALPCAFFRGVCCMCWAAVGCSAACIHGGLMTLIIRWEGERWLC
jgi:hypothetical protein